MNRVIALDGGSDGLDCYRQLAPQIAARLRRGGLALLEVGQGQADSVAAILAATGLEPAGVRADLGGRKRCVIFRKISNRSALHSCGRLQKNIWQALTCRVG